MRTWWRALAAALACVVPGAAALIETASLPPSAALHADSLLQSMPVVVVTLLALAALALGWPAALAIPSPVSAAALLAGAGVAALALSTPHDGVSSHEQLLPLGSSVGARAVLVIGIGLVAAFAREISRRNRDHLVESVATSVSGIVAVVALSLWPAAVRLPSGPVLAFAASVALAAGLLTARAVASRRRLTAVIVVATTIAALASARLAGAVLTTSAAAPPPVPLAVSALIGAAIGLVLAGVGPLLRLADDAPFHRADLAAWIIPVAITAIPIWVAGLALG